MANTKKYVVTGHIKIKGYRDTITSPLTKEEAQDRKKSLAKELKESIPQYRWVKALRVEEAK